MIEVELIKYLTKKGFRCGLERQKNADVILQKTGGSLLSHQFVDTFAIQTYGKTKQKSAELAYQVQDAMLTITSFSKKIAGVEVNATPYDFTDTSTKEYRYQAVYDIYEF